MWEDSEPRLGVKDALGGGLRLGAVRGSMRQTFVVGGKLKRQTELVK